MNKELKGEHMLKEGNKIHIVCTDVMLYIENSKLFANRLLKFLSKFSMVTDCEVNMHKSIVFPYMGRKQLEMKC